MKQTDLGLDLTRSRDLVALVATHLPVTSTGRPPFPVESMLRINFPQQRSGVSDMAMEDALFDVALYRQFAGLVGMSRLPDRVRIPRFRYLLEEHKLSKQFLHGLNRHLARADFLLKEATTIDATLIAAPSLTKNKDGERDSEMHQTKKGNQWHFGMKAHIGADAYSGLGHTVVGIAANVNDVMQAHALVDGEEKDLFSDAGYRGVEKREETQDIKTKWYVAMRAGKRRALDQYSPMGKLLDEIECVKARIRAKVEHPFRVTKRQFGHLKVRYRGLAKNTQQSQTLFALSNLWMVRKAFSQGAMG